MTAKPSRNRWNQFQSFLQEASPSRAPQPDPQSVRRDLEALGLDVERVDLAVAEIVALGRSRARDGWLERARRAQADFERAVRARKQWVSQGFGNAREIVAAIASGRLGPGVQSQAFVFFRNGDLNSASETDLRSFLDDCELLGLIQDGEEEGK